MSVVVANHNDTQMILGKSNNDMKPVKTTMKEAALNVLHINMMMNRTFLRSQLERQELEQAVKASFPCFEGISGKFLQELLEVAQVTLLSASYSRGAPHTS
jgi:hypothetical protein